MIKECPRCQGSGRGKGRFLIVHVETTTLRGARELRPIRSCRQLSTRDKPCGYWEWF